MLQSATCYGYSSVYYRGDDSLRENDICHLFLLQDLQITQNDLVVPNPKTSIAYVNNWKRENSSLKLSGTCRHIWNNIMVRIHRQKTLLSVAKVFEIGTCRALLSHTRYMRTNVFLTMSTLQNKGLFKQTSALITYVL